MFVNIFNKVVDGVLKRRLLNLSQRETVVAALMAGFSQLRKKPVPDLATRLQKLENRLRQMSEEVSIGFVNGRLVVKTAAASESLLKELRLGSDWYEPWEKVDETLLAAILVDPEK